MITKCDICKQEELIPDSLIGDREITGGIRHSDWKICLKTLCFENSKLKLRVAKLDACLEDLKCELPHMESCDSVHLRGETTECDCPTGSLIKEINSVLGK